MLVCVAQLQMKASSRERSACRPGAVRLEASPQCAECNWRPETWKWDYKLRSRSKCISINSHLFCLHFISGEWVAEMTRVVPFGEKLLTSRPLETLGRIQDIRTDWDWGRQCEMENGMLRCVLNNKRRLTRKGPRVERFLKSREATCCIAMDGKCPAASKAKIQDIW